jgi:hypothetical protein
MEELTATTAPSTPADEIPLTEVAQAIQIRNPWICHSCGAIMGSVHKEKVRQGLSISRLILFRGAIKLDEALPLNFVFGKVDAGEFGCSRCGTIRHWHPSPEALQYLSEGNHHARKKNRNA